MEKIIEETFKAFNHIAREFQIYFLSGFLVFMNVYAIDSIYFEGSLWNKLASMPYALPLILLAYIIGHISMALYEFLFQLKYDQGQTSLPELYHKDKELYLAFVERKHILTFMRFNLSTALLINFLTGLAFLILKPYHWQMGLICGLCIAASLLLFRCSFKTKKEYSNAIVDVKKTLGIH